MLRLQPAPHMHGKSKLSTQVSYEDRHAGSIRSIHGQQGSLIHLSSDSSPIRCGEVMPVLAVGTAIRMCATCEHVHRVLN